MGGEDDGGSVKVGLRLRPLRLAFLVSYNDRRGLERAIEVSTCLWGGQLNAIIPVYGRAPHWATSEVPRLSSKSIVEGYLEAFEPDYVVADTAYSHLLKGHQVIPWDEILPRRGHSYVKFGLSVLEVYGHLYREEFKFVSKNTPAMILPRPSGRSLDLLNGVMFGRFPSGREVAHFERSYKELFEPEDKHFDGSNVFQLMNSHIGTPLGVGNLEIRPHRPLGLSKPVLFYLDPTCVADLIDLWNLRAIGWSPIPIAKQWATDVLDTSKTLIRRQQEKEKRSALRVPRAEILCSRTANRGAFDDFVKAVGTSDHPVTTRVKYPRIWNAFGRRADGVERVDVRVSEDVQRCEVESGRVSFESIGPGFVGQDAIDPTARWANVVLFRERRVDANIASVFPRRLTHADRLLDTMAIRGTTSATSEGLVLKADGFMRTQSWRLPDGPALFKFWLKQQGFECQLSSAGRLAAQLARMLGGPFFSKIYADVEVLQLIEKSSHGKAIDREHWLQVLSRANSSDHKRAIEHLDALVEAGILRLGVGVQCSACARSTWLGLEDIRYEAECTHCLSRVRFPAANPGSVNWQYRTVGPFSVGNHAHGSLAVLLAVRFFTLPLASPTWTPSMRMTGTRRGELEFDVALLLSRSESANTSEPILVFGECKSFNDFEDVDIARARQLANCFPSAVILFATMKRELNDKEKRLISKFALAGRERWKTPVLVLTAFELMGNHLGAPDCWRDVGGKFEPFAKTTVWQTQNNLVWLCDATQQLHLGLPHGSGIPWD